MVPPTRQPCPYEAELLEQLSRFPAGGVLEPVALDPPLCRHLGHCRPCRELAALAQVLRADGVAAAAGRVLPTASQVWWRARVRCRVAAADAAERPMKLVHLLTLAAVGALALSLAGGPWAARASGGDDRLWHVVASAVELTAGTPMWWLAAAVGCLIVLMPVAVLLTTRGE